MSKEITKIIPLVEIKTAGDIKPDLPEKVSGFLEGILKGARSSFEEDHECHPYFFMMKEDGEVMPVIFKEISPETKHAVFTWMHEQVPNYEACIFVVETWYAMALPSEFKDGAGMLLQPSQRVDRREMVMVTLWMKKERRLSLMAEITRKPDVLGPWKVMDDTGDPNRKLRSRGDMLGEPIKEGELP